MGNKCCKVSLFFAESFLIGFYVKYAVVHTVVFFSNTGGA